MKQYILVIIIVILALFIAFKKPAKGLYDQFKKEWIMADESVVRAIDSINKLQVDQKKAFDLMITEANIRIEQKNSEIRKANIKIRENEKKLANYFNGDFDQRFDQFTKFVTYKN